MTSRRKLREMVFSLLFQIEVGKHDAETELDKSLEDTEMPRDDVKYFRTFIRGVMHERHALDGVIEQYAKGWKLGRIAKTDLSVLRMAIFELLFGLSGQEAELPIVINEAVMLAKKFSGPKSGKFVNGILGSIARDMDDTSKTVGRIAADNVFK